MKILRTMTAAALFVIGTAVMAQGQGNRQMRPASERAKMESEMLVKSLELNADQTAKIQEITLKFAVKDSVRFAERRKGQESGEFDRDAMMKAMQADRAAKLVEVKALLTDAQKAKYDAFLKEREQRGPRQGGQNGQ